VLIRKKHQKKTKTERKKNNVKTEEKNQTNNYKNIFLGLFQSRNSRGLLFVIFILILNKSRAAAFIFPLLFGTCFCCLQKNDFKIHLCAKIFERK